MNEEISVACPYCGQPLIIEPEPFEGPMEYVEDCHVCCQPIVVTVHYSEKGSKVFARRENE